MRLDTECDVVVAAEGEGQDQLRGQIINLRNDLLAEHLDMSPQDVAQQLADNDSLIALIEGNCRPRGQGRTLIPFEIPDLNGFHEWLAENEILDPEGPDKIFESISKRGLFKNWHWRGLGRRFRRADR
jgi:hypothetical protein